jgi:hypothetical protein
MECMACPNKVSSHMSSSSNITLHQATHLANTWPTFRDMKHSQEPSASSLTTSPWSTPAKMTPNIFCAPWRLTTQSPQTRRQTYNVASPSPGNTTNTHSTYPCQDVLRRHYSVSTTTGPQACIILRTHGCNDTVERAIK